MRTTELARRATDTHAEYQQGKFVATDAGQRVAATQTAPQALGRIDDQVIGRFSAMRLVDRGKIVDIDVADRHPASGQPRLFKRLPHALSEKQAIRQPGQHIVAHGKLELLAMLARFKTNLFLNFFAL